MRGCKVSVVALTSLSLGILVAVPARAASLQKVDQSEWWGEISGLPSYVNMYIYVPDQPAAKPPIVVGPHHCQGNGSGTYSEMSSLVSLANKNGFIMIFPEATGQNCWDAGSPKSLKHDGKGDTHAIAQMVRYTLSKYKGDAARVYSVGGSSGGIMTEALLGVYPDIFMAGVSLMGVPCGCWGQDYKDVTGKGSDAQWSGPCAGGNVTKTGAQWGDLVRSYFPGYTGHRPRLQHWHGTSDTTLSYKNMAEDIKEWTNLLGLSETPTGTDTPKSGTTRQYWKNSCDYTVYETFALSGVGHSVAFDGSAVAAYFGLDKAGTEDPETSACTGAVPGGGESDGGSAGDGAGGAIGAAGKGRDGGLTGRDASTSGRGGDERGGEAERDAAASSGYGGNSGHGRGGRGDPEASGSGAGGKGETLGNAGAATGAGGSHASRSSSDRSGGGGGVREGNGGAHEGSSEPEPSGVAPGQGSGATGCVCSVRNGVRASLPGKAALLLAAMGLLRRRSKRAPAPPPTQWIA